MSAPRALAEWQRWLRWVWTDPRGVRAALSIPSPARPEPLPRVADRIGPGAPGRVRRLEVYANAYFERLLSALAAGFPTLRAAMGDGAFRGLAADYLRGHPSRSHRIDDVGRALPDFLVGRGDVLRDIAALERAVLESLTTDRSRGLAPGSLRGLPPAAWPRLRVRFDRSLRWVDVDWAVERLWDRRADPSPRRRPAAARRPGLLIVHWNSSGPACHRPSAPEARVFRRLSEGQPLGRALADGQGGLRPGAVGHWFARWAARGWIAEVRHGM